MFNSIKHTCMGKMFYCFPLFLISFTFLILTSCTEESTNPPLENLNDINNPPGGYINEIGINSSGDFFAATHEGFFISTDRGSTWWSQTRLVDTGESVTEFKITSKDYIFLSYVKAGHSYLLRSLDNGNSWTSLISSIPSIREIEEDQLGNIYVAGSRLQKSTDNGETWEVIYERHVTDICFPSPHLVIIGITQSIPGQILFSTDNGNNWDSTGYPIHVASFYLYDSLLFAGGVSSIYGGGGIHKSMDGGMSWNPSGLSSASTTQFILNNKNQLIIGTGYGVFYTSNLGESWQPIIGIGSVPISFMKDEYGFLYTGTTNGSFLRSTDNGMTWHN